MDPLISIGLYVFSIIFVVVIVVALDSNCHSVSVSRVFFTIAITKTFQCLQSHFTAYNITAFSATITKFSRIVID